MKINISPNDILEALKKLYDEIASKPQKYLFLVVLVFLVFFGLFGDYGLFQRVKYEYLHYKYEAELKEAQEKTRELKLKIQKAEDLEEVEHVAREKYNMTKEGEKVYIIKSK